MTAPSSPVPAVERIELPGGLFVARLPEADLYSPAVRWALYWPDGRPLKLGWSENDALAFAATLNASPTPGRAAEPDTTVTGDEAETLAMVHQLIAMGDNRTFRASTVLALMNERAALRTRAETAEAQLSTLRAEVDGMAQSGRDVLAERRRQIEAEGWSSNHDRTHTKGELADAAASYAVRAHAGQKVNLRAPGCWPWEPGWWKPGKPRRNLVKAGALILAEIDRLDHYHPSTSGADR